MKISIIIPVYNEERYIGKTLSAITKNCCKEEVDILVVDSGSDDKTIEIVREYDVQLLETSVKCRSVQMNMGAAHLMEKIPSFSGGNIPQSEEPESDKHILYFLHADAIPPNNFIEEIKDAVRSGYEMGIFSYVFDSDSRMLKFNAWFNQFDGLFTGGGDQSLFIEHAKFQELNGYREDHLLMEDFEFYKRAKKKLNHTIIRDPLTVSARKYENNSWMRVQVVNLLAFMGYYMGMSQERLCRFYCRALK